MARWRLWGTRHRLDASRCVEPCPVTAVSIPYSIFLEGGLSHCPARPVLLLFIRCPRRLRRNLRQSFVFNDIDFSEQVRIEVRGLRKIGENPVLGSLDFEVRSGRACKLGCTMRSLNDGGRLVITPRALLGWRPCATSSVNFVSKLCKCTLSGLLATRSRSERWSRSAPRSRRYFDVKGKRPTLHGVCRGCG